MWQVLDNGVTINSSSNSIMFSILIYQYNQEDS